MYIIVPIIFLGIVFWSVILPIVAGGMIVGSGDKVVKPEMPESVEPEPEKSEPKAYVRITGQDFELFTEAQVKAAKKDGYTVIYK